MPQVHLERPTKSKGARKRARRAREAHAADVNHDDSRREGWQRIRAFRPGRLIKAPRRWTTPTILYLRPYGLLTPKLASSDQGKVGQGVADAREVPVIASPTSTMCLHQPSPTRPRMARGPGHGGRGVSGLPRSRKAAGRAIARWRRGRPRDPRLEPRRFETSMCNVYEINICICF